MIWINKYDYENSSNSEYLSEKENSLNILYFNSSIKNEKSNIFDNDSEKGFINSFNHIFVENTNAETIKTQLSPDFLNKKRNPSKREQSPIEEVQEKIEEIKHEKFIINKKAKGRKKKEENYNDDEPGVHTKYSEDNVMRTIKTALFKQIIKELNDSLDNKKYKFSKLDPKIHQDLKVATNKELLNTTIGNIYRNPSFQCKNGNNSNIKLIEEIYAENKDLEAIKILNMSFREFWKYIKEQKLNDFLNEIKEKEINNKIQDSDKYMGKMENLLINFEDWFYSKKARNRKKNCIIKNF